MQVQALTTPSQQSFQEERDLHNRWLFFHRICQVRASYNAIRIFTTAAGTRVTDPTEMSQLAVAHFQSVLGPLASCSPPIASMASWFSGLFDYRVSPDGLTSGFFKASWEVIGQGLVDSIQHFFATAFLPASANATILSLIPKFPEATKVSDFQPISCLNTVYKVISRLLVTRLKPFLPEFIVPCQTAFVKDRHQGGHSKSV